MNREEAIKALHKIRNLVIKDPDRWEKEIEAIEYAICLIKNVNPYPYINYGSDNTSIKQIQNLMEEDEFSGFIKGLIYLSIFEYGQSGRSAELYKTREYLDILIQERSEG